MARWTEFQCLGEQSSTSVNVIWGIRELIAYHSLRAYARLCGVNTLLGWPAGWCFNISVNSQILSLMSSEKLERLYHSLSTNAVVLWVFGVVYVRYVEVVMIEQGFTYWVLLD